MEAQKKPEKKFTLEQLRECDGKNGRPACIAIEGKVYDVTDSRLWREGNHAGLHHSGADLTEMFPNAPHNRDVFSRVSLVGELVEDKTKKRRFTERLEKFHPHPVMIHFPLAYLIIAPVFAFLFLATRNTSFEASSYYMLVLGFLSIPLAAATGYLSWKEIFQGRTIKPVLLKMRLTALVFLLAAVSVIWRTLNPDVLLSQSAMSFVYVFMITGLVPLVAIIGHYGGKLIYH